MTLIGHVHSNWHLYSCTKNTEFSLGDDIIQISKQEPRRLIRKVLEIDSETKTSCVSPRANMEDYKSLEIYDPMFSGQWHLNNNQNEGNDINVLPVWKRGISGSNVTVCFVDDGLDYNHPDLKDNFYAAGSHDFNDHTHLPTPGNNGRDHHGTRCAGEVGAIRNNFCGERFWHNMCAGREHLEYSLPYCQV